jgi:membrane-associated phospholipid phosphatase
MASELKTTEHIELIGDAFQVIIPMTAAYTDYIDEEYEELEEFAVAFGVTMIVTHVLKETTNKKRPNGGDNAFPSGHVSASFVGAAHIYNEQSETIGLVAYGMATFVAYSRVKADKHDFADVLGGAVLGVASEYGLDYLYDNNILPHYINIAVFGDDNSISAQFGINF